MNKTSLDVSIVIGKNEKFILPCLHSIFKETTVPLEIYVTCNWKMPKIVQKIQTEFPAIHLLVNKEPRGFAQNHNRVIKKSQNDYILILNDDTLILNKCIDKLFGYMENNPQVAVVSPRLLNPDLSLQPSTFGFPNMIKAGLFFIGIKRHIPYNRLTLKLANLLFHKDTHAFWKHDKIRQVQTMAGTCVLVRRKAIEEIGLMDEVSLAYGEEPDWNYRMWQKGWKIIYNPEAEIIHYNGQTLRKMGAVIEYERVKGLLNFYRKHRSHMKLMLLKDMIFGIYKVKLGFAKLNGDSEKIKIYQQVCKFLY